MPGLLVAPSTPFPGLPSLLSSSLLLQHSQPYIDVMIFRLPPSLLFPPSPHTFVMRLLFSLTVLPVSPPSFREHADRMEVCSERKLSRVVACYSSREIIRIVMIELVSQVNVRVVFFPRWLFSSTCTRTAE